jgi:hypothetical protein
MYIIITSLVMFLFINACKNNEINCPPHYNINTGRVIIPSGSFIPENYVCYRTEALIIDGNLDEEAWQSAEWTKDFVDIEGDLKPEPLHRTRVKMLWDDNYLYIAAELTEPHIWAKLQQRDTVIFYDNDFEVFIDPDGDTHEYLELEMNAFNTLWDLMLTRPYRDNGRDIDSWDIRGIKSAVKVHGSINDPSDTDDKWIVELALPMTVLTEVGNTPSDGDQWRINFSRVNWRTVTENGTYRKATDPETGKPYPEYNWVWSAQGVINMHYPERWGYLQFSGIEAGKGKAGFEKDADEDLKWNLRTLYYAQKNHAAEKGSYTSDIDKLAEYGYQKKAYQPCIILKPFGYEAYQLSDSSLYLWTIDNSGKIFSNNTGQGGPGKE